MVWRTRLGVDAYVAAGRGVVVPRLACPSCSTAMTFWGWYRRDVRVGDVVRLWVRRLWCRPCRATHAVLPEFVTHGRLDGVEVIGDSIALMAAGVGARPVALRAGAGHTTARDWRQRFAGRAELLVAGYVAATVAVSGLSPRVSGDAEIAALAAVDALWSAAAARWPGGVGSRWRLANVVIGSHLLSTNTDPLFAVR
jgi:Domain of unknown function (DUF6431)